MFVRDVKREKTGSPRGGSKGRRPCHPTVLDGLARLTVLV